MARRKWREPKQLTFKLALATAIPPLRRKAKRRRPGPAGQTQLLLPGLPLINPEAKKIVNEDFFRKDGTPRTPKGIERRLRRHKRGRWSREERKAHQEYEETGIDNTDGKRYW